MHPSCSLTSRAALLPCSPGLSSLRTWILPWQLTVRPPELVHRIAVISARSQPNPGPLMAPVCPHAACHRVQALTGNNYEPLWTSSKALHPAQRPLPSRAGATEAYQPHKNLFTCTALSSPNKPLDIEGQMSHWWLRDTCPSTSVTMCCTRTAMSRAAFWCCVSQVYQVHRI